MGIAAAIVSTAVAVIGTDRRGVLYDSRMPRCCTSFPPPYINWQLIMSLNCGGAGSLSATSGTGTSSRIIQPKSVIYIDSSGGHFWSAAFHSMVCRCAHNTCRNRFGDVGGSALALGLFLFRVCNVKLADSMDVSVG